MTTATGDYVIDFTTAADQNPFSNPAFSKVKGTQDAKIESGSLRATSADSDARWYVYTGASEDGTGIMQVNVELAQWGNQDHIIFGVLDASGNGYYIQITYSPGPYANFIYSLAYTGVSYGGYDPESGVSLTAGDVLSLRVEKSGGSTTNVKAYKNGSRFTLGGYEDMTEAGALGSLRGLFGLKPENSNSTKIASFGVDGLATSTPGAITPNTATLTV